MLNPFTAVSDVNGDYTLKVAAGSTYVVTANHVDWPGQTYDGYDGCGCAHQYTPVVADPPPAGPETGIDFDFLPPDAYLYGLTIGDSLIGGSGGPVGGVDVHVYRSVAGAWVELATVQSDSSSYWDLNLADAGTYRVRFSYMGVWLRIFDTYTELSSGDASGPDELHACFVDTAAIPSGESFFLVTGLVDPATDSSCGPEPASTSGGGGGVPPRPRSGGSSSSATSAAITPTPTPTPTPTSSVTPRPTASPTPSATPVATDETPASAPDLWWLLWVLLGIVVIVVVGGVVYFVRRT
jgi:hypothetical protein